MYMYSQLAAGWATVKLARQLLHFTTLCSARLRRSTMTYDYRCPCLSLSPSLSISASICISYDNHVFSILTDRA